MTTCMCRCLLHVTFWSHWYSEKAIIQDEPIQDEWGKSNLFYYIFWITLNMIYWTFHTRRKYIKFLSFVLSCIKIDLNKKDFLENIHQFFEILKLSHKDVLGFIYCTEFYYLSNLMQNISECFNPKRIVIIQNIVTIKLDVFISSAML